MSGAPAGAWAIDWAETETDGMPGLEFGEIAAGVEWLWRGAAHRMDAPGSVMPLGAALGRTDLLGRAGRRVARMMRAEPRPAGDVPVDLLTDGFAVTDGRSRWHGQWLAGGDALRDRGAGIAMFDGGLPPRATPLWVVAVKRRIRRPTLTVPALLQGLVEGTRIATPASWRPIEALAPGDRVLTRDGGAQRVLAVTARHVSGVRMRLDPGLRAVRLAVGAFGPGQPAAEVLVSSAARILVRNRAVQDLFGTSDVLVAAADLHGGGAAARVFHPAGLTYHALTLAPGPAGPHLISAAGLWCETFSPTMEQALRPCLSAGEAAILASAH